MYYLITDDAQILFDLQNAIADEELAASCFIECEAATLINKAAGTSQAGNLIKFQEMEPGTRPKPPTLSFTPMPDRGAQSWKGQMYVEGKMRTVYLYR